MAAKECDAPQGRGLICLPEGYTYKVTPVDEETKWSLMPQVRPLHEKLGFEPSRTEREVFDNTEEGKEVGILKNPEGEVIAFVAQRLEELYMSGKQASVVSVATRVVNEDYQRQHFGTFLVQETILRHNPIAITGRTPNANVLRMLEDTGFISEIYPVDNLYPPSVQIALAGMLGQERMIRDRIHLRTGRCIGVYQGAKLYIDRENLGTGARRIHDILTNPPINANLVEGDGIRYWAVVNKKFYDDPTKAVSPQAA